MTTKGPMSTHPHRRLAVVFGTYNRLRHLQSAVASVRAASGVLDVTMIVVDGGSTDGSRAWLAEQPDVVLIGQRGPLTGAVHAFNLGFGYAVDDGFPYVMHLNDDAEVLPEGIGSMPALEAAVHLLEEHPTTGEVAFAFDLRNPGKFGFETIHGRIYANFGVVRTEAGRAVAIAQGDPTGRAWWNPIYLTYAADCEFAAWMIKLGWAIHGATELRVHDLNVQDKLRADNTMKNASALNSELFWSRWPNRASIEPDASYQVRLVLPERPAAPAPGAATSRMWQGAKVHLGCGTHRLVGWVNVDGLASTATDVVFDFSHGLPFVPNGSLQAVYWSHGPEHIYPDLLPGLLRDLRRVLAPGGELIVAAPDFEGIYKHRFAGHENGYAWLAAVYGECTSTDHPFLAHKQCFTQDTMQALLRDAGFENVRSWEPKDYPDIARVRDYAITCELVSCLSRGTAGAVVDWKPLPAGTVESGIHIQPSVPPVALPVAPAIEPRVWTSDMPPTPSGVQRASGYPDPTLLVPPPGEMSPWTNEWIAGERVLHVALRDAREGQPGLARALRSIATRDEDYADIDWVASEGRGGNQLVQDVLDATARLRPTIVFMQLQRATAITAAVVEKIRQRCAPNVVIINWDGDQHFEAESPQRAWFRELGTACDTSLVVNTKHPAIYRDLGVVRPGFLEIGIDGDIYRPIEDPKPAFTVPPVVLFASNYPQTPAYGPRLALVRELQAMLGQQFGVYGGGWRGWASGHALLTQNEEAQHYNAARYAISMSIRNDLPRYTSDRLFRALACGTFVFVELFDDMEGLGLQVGHNIFAFTEAKGLSQTMRELVAAPNAIVGPSVRSNAAALGRLHTWSARMLELMAIVRTVRAHRNGGEE